MHHFHSVNSLLSLDQLLERIPTDVVLEFVLQQFVSVNQSAHVLSNPSSLVILSFTVSSGSYLGQVITLYDVPVFVASHPRTGEPRMDHSHPRRSSMHGTECLQLQHLLSACRSVLLRLIIVLSSAAAKRGASYSTDLAVSMQCPSRSMLTNTLAMHRLPEPLQILASPSPVLADPPHCSASQCHASAIRCFTFAFRNIATPSRFATSPSHSSSLANQRQSIP